MKLAISKLMDVINFPSTKFLFLWEVFRSIGAWEWLEVPAMCSIALRVCAASLVATIQVYYLWDRGVLCPVVF